MQWIALEQRVRPHRRGQPQHDFVVPREILDLHAEQVATGHERVMLDSTKLLYDPATMRNYPLSEYILKS